MEANRLTAHELLGALKEKRLSPKDIDEAIYARIGKIDSKVRAYPRTGNSGKEADEKAVGCAGPLCGLPVTVKDNICTTGLATECCSRILSGFYPPYDATVIAKLKSAGARIFPWKANMDEFAFGSSTENSCFGPTCNPWNTAFVPGGSSGGSAAAVAGDEAIWALGSDTGGSIRQPASFCGVVGLKPTYGRVSRFGLVAFASSLDQIGPITKDVEDSAILTGAISGYDPNDSTSVDYPVPDYTKSLGMDIKGLRIGMPKEYFVEGLDEQVKLSVKEAAGKLESLGACLKEVSLPHAQYAVPVYYIIATAEASSNLARFDGVKYGYRAPSESLMDMYKKTRSKGFGEEAKRRIILGTFALSHGYYDAYYLRALKVRTLIKKDFDTAFGDFDCIIAPTSPTPAFRIGEKASDPLKMYLSDIYTISVNLAGIPAISIPCGFTREGLPVGLQVMAKPFNEEMIFRVAHAFERNTEWHKARPQL